MAYIRVQYCYVCCKDTYHTNHKCNDCKASEYEQKHREHFAKLDSMTLEERVRRLELNEWNMSQNPPWNEDRYA